MPREVPVYMVTGDKDAFGLSSFIDHASKKLLAEQIDRVDAAVAPGSYVFMQKSFADYFWRRKIPGPTDWYYSYTLLQMAAYEKLRYKYVLCIIEESKNGMLAAVAVPKLDNKQPCANPYDL